MKIFSFFYPKSIRSSWASRQYLQWLKSIFIIFLIFFKQTVLAIYLLETVFKPNNNIKIWHKEGLGQQMKIESWNIYESKKKLKNGVRLQGFYNQPTKFSEGTKNNADKGILFFYHLKVPKSFEFWNRYLEIVRRGRKTAVSLAWWTWK